MTSSPTPSAADRPAPPRWLKPTVEYGPIIAFFVAYKMYDLLTATAVLMAVTTVGLALSYAIARRVPMMSVVTAVIVAVFGGLTLWLNDDRFIKMKPTILEAAFGLILMGGVLFNKLFLKMLLGEALPLEDKGWRTLTIRFALFFFAMAVLNEIVWRNVSEAWWVDFKVFGLPILTFAFMLCQVPMIMRHTREKTDTETPSE